MSLLNSILKKIWPRKIRTQLILGVALVHLGLMSFFVADTIQRQRKFLKEENHEHTFSFLNDYAFNSNSFILANDFDGLARLTQSRVHFPNLKYAMILSPEGEVLAHTNAKHIGTRLTDSISRQMIDATERRILAEDEQLLDIGTPIFEGKKIIGWARVGVGQGHIQTNLSTIMRGGMVYIVMALLLGTLFAVLIGNRLSRGLYKLISTTEKIKSGDRNVRAADFDSVELSKLGNAFNQMLDKVSSNEKLLGMVIETMPVGVWMFDAQGNIVSCNSSAKQLWSGVKNIGTNEFGPYKAWNVHTGEQIKENEWAVFRVIKSGEPIINEELEIETFDQNRKFILNSAMPLKNNEGKTLGAISINMDVTDNKKIMEQLRLSESVLRNAFEFSAIGMSLVLPQGKWLRVNKALCTMLGYSEQELLSLSFQDITWPEDLEPDMALVNKTLDGEINSYQMEKRYFHKNGSVIWARLSVSLVRDAYEKPLFFISQIEDISERKRSEAIILHEKNLSDNIINGMPGIFYLSDRDGKMLRWNSNLETITGYSSNEISSMNAVDFVSPSNMEQALSRRKQALAGGRASGEFELLTRQKQKLIYYVTVIPVFYNNQQSLLGIGVDFTEKKQSEKAILQFNRLYKFTSAINDMMLHTENKQALFAEACKIAVEKGGFALAWIGYFCSDTDKLKAFAWSGHNEGYLDLLARNGSRQDFENSAAGEAFKKRKPFYINDITNDTFKLPVPEEALNRGFRSLISLPVVVGSNLEAMFTLYTNEAFFFTEEEVRLLQEVINNIAYALEKFELKESQRLSQEQLQESEERFRKLVEETLVGVFILQNGKFVYVNPQFEKITAFPAAVLLNDMSFNDLIFQKEQQKTWNNYLATVIEDKHPGHNFPKLIRSDGMILHVEVITSPITYKGMPAVIGTMVDITAQTEEEKRLNKAVTDAQENQRQQISMELHDNVKQMMAASLLNIDFLKMVVQDEETTVPIIANVKNYMREAIEELRRIAHQLAPSVDETISLEEKFRTVVNSMNVSGKLTVNYHFENFDEDIKTDVQLAMYRILQEQFSNILKYANASLVDIKVHRYNGDIYMAVEDNGVGFDTTTKKYGIGLENIKRRVQVFNGNFKINSSPGKGCRLDVQIPVNWMSAEKTTNGH